MSLKKPALLLSSHSLCVPLSTCGNQQTSSTQHRCFTGTTIVSQHRRRLRRTYATVAESHSSPSADDELHWPDVPDPQRLPNPYQIFNQKPHHPYSKRRFYDLVKIYHPDRSHPEDTSSSHNVSHSVRLERYRLIISANSILSDPSKRSAYDKYGFGWTDWREDSNGGGGGWSPYKYSTFHRWRADAAARYQWPTDADPMYNATWEDWERWYEKQRNPNAHRSGWNQAFFSQGVPQHTVFANNYVFLSLVAILAALGGIGQATRANEYTKTRSERISLVNEENAKHLISAREDARELASSGSKEDRIKKWVQTREGYSEDEPDGRTLRSDDDGLCSSGLVKDKDKAPFWKRPPEPWER